MPTYLKNKGIHIFLESNILMSINEMIIKQYSEEMVLYNLNDKLAV